MKIAIAQINSSLADFKTNLDKILAACLQAKAQGAELILFPEAALFGYPPFDLIEIHDFVEAQERALKKLEKKIPPGLVAVVGVIIKSKLKKGRPYFNSAAWVEKNKKTKFFHKQLLPTGDVFDESRFIQSGNLQKNITKFRGKNCLITICEDIWAWPDDKGISLYTNNPIKNLKEKKIDLILNLSASPYYPKKIEKRKELAKKTSRFFKAPFVFCNAISGQDEIIFDGQSFVLDSKGNELLQLESFQEDFSCIDLFKKDKTNKLRSRYKLSGPEELRRALVLGLRDFCQKTGMPKVHLGLSGGVDSALVACLAVDALGPKNVTAFALPTQFNASKSLELAKTLAKNLDIQFEEFSIESVFNFFSEKINEHFKIQKFGVLHENLQARIRGTFLMSYSNLQNSLLLSTSNKSEIAVGYTTLYGDMCGGLMPIGDLTKKQVYELCLAYNREHELIPAEILTRAPSAELRLGQKDQDSLPEYDVLDKEVLALIENSNKTIGKTNNWLFQQMMKTEFKRWQSPPILKVSKHAFGRGRRWPIAKNTISNR